VAGYKRRTSSKGKDNMKILSKLAAAGAVLFASFLPMAAAHAETCTPPYCNPEPRGGVLPNEEERPASVDVPRGDDGPSGELAFTGGDVVGLTVIGAGALGIGTLLVRRSKAAKQVAA
jgi:hypothetical protein